MIGPTGMATIGIVATSNSRRYSDYPQRSLSFKQSLILGIRRIRRKFKRRKVSTKPSLDYLKSVAKPIEWYHHTDRLGRQYTGIKHTPLKYPYMVEPHMREPRWYVEANGSYHETMKEAEAELIRLHWESVANLFNLG